MWGIVSVSGYFLSFYPYTRRLVHLPVPSVGFVDVYLTTFWNFPPPLRSNALFFSLPIPHFFPIRYLFCVHRLSSHPGKISRLELNGHHERTIVGSLRFSGPPNSPLLLLQTSFTSYNPSETYASGFCSVFYAIGDFIYIESVSGYPYIVFCLICWIERLKER
ncbi:unnamed protein product [Lactuca virosa]|uniref:Uncharacterized protein n=1 Tax=Lactuca virosa TaxID=75947 RepID=A0AAU9MIV4_9ASTR|nr:unnamed protein product [Lactuca virosa]